MHVREPQRDSAVDGERASRPRGAQPRTRRASRRAAIHPGDDPRADDAVQHRAVSVAVIDGGRVVWARAYGLADIASGRAATPATLFQAASMSKAVASTATLLLVQEGTLALDTPVNERLRSWRIPENAFTAGHPVTLRQLLTHTAGLTVPAFPGYAAGAPVPTLVQELDGTPPANTAAARVDTTPGVRFSYSGGGVSVMQLLLTDVTGKDFPTLMRERGLGPAGMRARPSSSPSPRRARTRRPPATWRRASRWKGGTTRIPRWRRQGLWTTASDLARWVLTIQRSLTGEHGGLLSRATATAMVTPGLGDWGLGVELTGSGDSLAFTHSGGIRVSGGSWSASWDGSAARW